MAAWQGALHRHHHHFPPNRPWEDDVQGWNVRLTAKKLMPSGALRGWTHGDDATRDGSENSQIEGVAEEPARCQQLQHHQETWWGGVVTT